MEAIYLSRRDSGTPTVMISVCSANLFFFGAHSEPEIGLLVLWIEMNYWENINPVTDSNVQTAVVDSTEQFKKYALVATKAKKPGKPAPVCGIA